MSWSYDTQLRQLLKELRQWVEVMTLNYVEFSMLLNVAESNRCLIKIIKLYEN